MKENKKDIVLIVDDEPKNLDVLYQLLKQDGLKVLIAEDGETALKRVDYILPDIILLDIKMPKMDGYETCERIKNNPATQHIPIIFVTALSDAIDEMKGFSVGGVDYITKPIHAATTLARIKTHLDLRKAQNSLTELNGFKDKLLSILSHELRSPLDALDEILYLFNDDNLTEIKMKEYISELSDTIKRNRLFLENLMHWSYYQIQRDNINMEEFELSELIRETISFVKPIAKKKSIKLEYNPLEKCYVRNNPNVVKLVITNLVVNAIKFTHPGLRIKITYKISNNIAKVSVEDPGIGMEQELIDDVLTGTNYKISQGTKGEKGAGLGLKLSKEFIELTGGEFFIRSELNKGSEFSFTVKLSDT